MINFQKLTPDQKDAYNELLMVSEERGCEYAFANLYLWGKQQVAFIHGCAVFFSHFYGRSVYPFPAGPGDKRAAIQAILEDARQRGIPCRITSVTDQDREDLENWFPGVFHVRAIRDSFDYVYSIHDLADLRGRKFQKKRNHFNRFCNEHPDYRLLPLDAENLPIARELVNHWYARRKETDPEGDYLLEALAMTRAFNHFHEIGMEGILLMDGEEAIAVTMGTRLSPDSFDVHFEKAREDVEGAYNAINCEFARYLRLKYPELQYLNREDDMGLEGLRKAKLSYHPHHMIEKYWAYVTEDIHEA